MFRFVRFLACASLMSAGSATVAQVEHVKELVEYGSFSYSHDDKVVGGKMAFLSVSVSYTWPPSDWLQVTYSGQQCTADYCYEWGGIVSCGCFTSQSFQGSGRIPASAFSVSPQGVAHLDFTPDQLAENGWTYGDCTGVHLTATPTGEWHESKNGQLTVETPTDTTRAVSREDDWVTNATGTVCSMTLTAEDPGSGSVHKGEWNRVIRTLKP